MRDVLGLVMLAGMAMHAGAATGEPAHPVLVELFTSEGCSSCPPADALLRSIDGKRIDSGQMVVGISEHVTYWNRLGWTDPFSAETYTQRQEGYRTRFGLESAYTPQVVVNGEREVLGSDRAAVMRAVRETDHRQRAGTAVVTIDIRSAVLVGDKVKVAYSVSGLGEGREADVYAVVAEDEVMSEVPRGENSGRRLTHVSVARSFTRLGAATGDGERTAELPAGGVTHPGGRRHLVLFSQGVKLGPVLAIGVAPL